ncbi:MAG TPA: hypothetical protein VIY48_11745 [Candidatus Paceibacterota bacterium]
MALVMAVSQIRANHRYAFRPDEWAALIGVEVREFGGRWEPKENRPCFWVMFSDGVVDCWPIYDPDANYEFRTVAPGDGGVNNGTLNTTDASKT